MYLKTTISSVKVEQRESKQAIAYDDAESLCYCDRDDQCSVISDPIFQLTAMTNICLEGVNRPTIRMSRLSQLDEIDMRDAPPMCSNQALSSTPMDSYLVYPNNSCVPLSVLARNEVQVLDVKVQISPRLVRKSSSLRSVCETNEEEQVSLKPPERKSRQSSSASSSSSLSSHDERSNDECSF